MDNEKLQEKLKELDIEDFIWLIYIGIIFMSWYANSLERTYFKSKDSCSKKKYQHVMELIFSVLVIIYVYFFKDSYDGFKSIKPNDTDKKKTLVTLSFIASLLILISGILFLYIAFADDNLDVELAFN